VSLSPNTRLIAKQLSLNVGLADNSMLLLLLLRHVATATLHAAHSADSPSSNRQQAV
jgi:hypothetical protein